MRSLVPNAGVPYGTVGVKTETVFITGNPVRTMTRMKGKPKMKKTSKTQSKPLYRISKAVWEAIHPDYRGVWQAYFDDMPERKGLRVVMRVCLTNDPTENCGLLFEGIDFVIED